MIFQVSPKLSVARDLPQNLSANCSTNETLLPMSYKHRQLHKHFKKRQHCLLILFRQLQIQIQLPGHEDLCPPVFQWAVWHARLQYFATKQRPQRLRSATSAQHCSQQLPEHDIKTWYSRWQTWYSSNSKLQTVTDSICKLQSNTSVQVLMLIWLKSHKYQFNNVHSLYYSYC